MRLVPRPYQQDLCDRVAAAFRQGVPSVLMQLGTGGGKTATCSVLLERAIERGYRAAFFAHLDSLVGDTHQRLVALGVPTGFVQAGRPSDPEAPVQVCSLQTMHSRGARPPADFVVVDEAHRAMGATVRAILDAYPHAAILGLTATPQRGDRKPLGDVFEEMVCGPSNRWLTDNGFLVPCDVIAPSQYIENALAAHPVKAYARHAKGLRTIVFASNKIHARDLADTFNAAGYPAAVMLGETPREEREDLRARLASGELLVLVGVDVFVEGFDVPEIECVILARAFGVTGAFLQSIGRGLRPAIWTGKRRCIVIDLRGAVYLHGLPDEDRAWSLTGKAVRRTETITALMRCKECLAVFRPAAACPRCGEKTKGAPKVPRVLSRPEKLALLNDVPAEERDARYLSRLVWVATTRMRMPSDRAHRWAVAKFRQQFKRDPGVKAA